MRIAAVQRFPIFDDPGRVVDAIVQDTARADEQGVDLWRLPRSGCWVASADITGRNDEGWLSSGCTAIVESDGTLVRRAAEPAEDVVSFDLP